MPTSPKLIASQAMVTRSSVFGIALESMKTQASSTFGPVNFQQYLRSNGLTKQQTGAAISVDSFDRLAKDLKNSGCMVFRLGAAADGRGTQFGLARYVNGWHDYFLFDQPMFSGCKLERYETVVPRQTLLAFDLLPALTESSYVNLALASGVIGFALGIDDGQMLVPATCRSTSTFRVRAHRDISVEWIHQKGQVEIDSLFIANRRGVAELFAIEAKTGDGRNSSLAKHKLAYPVLALRAQVRKSLPIVPVVLRAAPHDEGTLFSVAECSLPPDSLAISDLHVVEGTARQVLLARFGTLDGRT